MTATLLTLLPLASLAHHPLAEVYDRDSSMTLTGTVSRVNWVNPHAGFVLEVEDSAGTIVAWLVEMDPPHALERRGWPVDAIRIGQRVTVAGFRSLDGTPRTEAETITLPDGVTLQASTDSSWNWRPIN